MLNILYEDKDVAVLNKPAGISVHPAAHSPNEPALTKEILERWPEVKNVGDDPTLRPGIVHRLDKETSGVLVIAKNQTAFEFLKKQFQEREVEKTYLALVMGKMREKQGEIALPIGRSRKFGKFTTRVARMKNEELRIKKIREAKTKWRIAKEFKDFTLLEVKPETGRTHQIRVHLAAIGHPVAGDPLYGGKTNRSYREKLPRMFLHAESLKLKLPSGRVLLAEADLPSDLEEFLKSLARP